MWVMVMGGDHGSWSREGVVVVLVVVVDVGGSGGGRKKEEKVVIVVVLKLVTVITNSKNQHYNQHFHYCNPFNSKYYHINFYLSPEPTKIQNFKSTNYKKSTSFQTFSLNTSFYSFTTPILKYQQPPPLIN